MTDTGAITLTVHRPGRAAPASPWRADVAEPARWVLDETVATDDLIESARLAGQPCPALVHLGTVADDDRIPPGTVAVRRPRSVRPALHRRHRPRGRGRHRPGDRRVVRRISRRRDPAVGDPRARHRHTPRQPECRERRDDRCGHRLRRCGARLHPHRHRWATHVRAPRPRGGRRGVGAGGRGVGRHRPRFGSARRPGRRHPRRRARPGGGAARPDRRRRPAAAVRRRRLGGAAARAARGAHRAARRPGGRRARPARRGRPAPGGRRRLGPRRGDGTIRSSSNPGRCWCACSAPST